MKAQQPRFLLDHHASLQSPYTLIAKHHFCVYNYYIGQTVKYLTPGSVILYRQQRNVIKLFGFALKIFYSRFYVINAFFG